MPKKEKIIKWSLKNVTVLGVSIRSRKAISGLDEEYAVIQISLQDGFDDSTLGWHPLKSKKKIPSLMCFEPSIWKSIVEGEVFSFSGKVSFGYGTTFFCINNAFDQLGFPVTSEESIAFVETP